ncbi:GNAT family N-acetyltransferase [Paracidobacterium acidisoli]|uniref:GNAT family N-acetyltransferase n=1 Tax=Paracidobacterium acidisoli TaxID=2303751 RepID=A0A372IUE7_9BACT|nr:GNAT family N-acetyltransferase [Paracidobacterium acidisoli]MBT9329458.1 GNAT family N-acetyltransferase [Paracidobacterium acidisoli]
MSTQTALPDTDGRIEIRSCRGFDELEGCVRLQMETWGYSDGDVIPRRAFIVAQHIGGQVIGAFAAGRPAVVESVRAANLIGFAMSLPGIKSVPGGKTLPYLHSHMLAVTPEYRNGGIGRKLKLAQRDEALGRGISLMEWTFDPLEIKNSFLNIHRLGVVVRSYTSNFYGVSSSRLQGGLPTDRLHAEWWMNSDRVNAVLHGIPYTPPPVQETIVVPKEVSEWKTSETGLPRALAVQTENRERFLHAFARGLSVVGFRTDQNGNGFFELAPYPPPTTGN